MENTVYGLFKRAVETHGKEMAVIEDGRTLSFEDLSRMVDEIADGFPEEVHSVGVVMHHSAEMIAAILAILKCGGTYIPAEPDFPPGRIKDMMAESGAEFVITDDYFSDKKTTRHVSEPNGGPETPAYVLYTSGTTGKPKGVCVSNRNVCHYVRAFAAEFAPGPGDVFLQNSVCSFDIFVEEVFASLLNGAALAIPGEADRADINSLMAFSERHGVTVISGFPYLLAEMNQLESLPSSLRLLISGGDVLRGVYVDKLLHKLLVYNSYGPSETTVCATYYCCNEGFVLEDGTYPIGHPVKGAGVCVRDGEICISGDGVALGYIGAGEKESRAFERTESGVMYRTGDFGYELPDGNFAFLGRRDGQIMIYGKRVEISEVESRLYALKGVRHAVVRALKDEGGLSYMVAYLVPSERDKGLKISEIRAELSVNLPPYMIPEFFVAMENIPLNANGKPDVSALPVVLKGGL